MLVPVLNAPELFLFLFHSIPSIPFHHHHLCSHAFMYIQPAGTVCPYGHRLRSDNYKKGVKFLINQRAACITLVLQTLVLYRSITPGRAAANWSQNNMIPFFWYRSQFSLVWVYHQTDLLICWFADQLANLTWKKTNRPACVLTS